MKLEGKPTVQKVLDALRKGQSFLTNGPILYAEPRKEGMALTILGNLPLEQLYIYGSGGYERKMALTEREENQGKKYYDYSLILPWNEEIRECRWLFLQRHLILPTWRLPIQRKICNIFGDLKTINT